jgi:hypothetical protein
MDLGKMKALALAATPGPWQWWTSNSTLRLTGADGKDGGVLSGTCYRGVGDIVCTKANAAFIAAASPATVLELIAEVERLRDVAEEAAAVFESGAKHNREQGRTVFANAQQDRADRLRASIGAHTKAGKEPA